MTIETEMLWKILGFAFACGVLWMKMEAISKDIKRLEKKQDKYNNLQERCHTLELWKEYHEKEHDKEGK